MDEIRKFPFEEPGCEHFPLLLYVSCILILLRGNQLTIATNCNIQPVVSCDYYSTSTTTATRYQIAVSSRVERGLVIDALSRVLHHSKRAKMSFSNYVDTYIY